MIAMGLSRASSAAVVLSALLVGVVNAQAPEPSFLKPASRVSAVVSIEPQKPGHSPGTAIMAVDVTLAPGIHVYARGNKDYIPVELTVSPPRGIKAAAPEYPPSEALVFGALKEVVQVYARPFRVRVPITIAADAPPATVTAGLRVQACNDKVCFPPETLPISVAIPPRPAGGKAR